MGRLPKVRKPLNAPINVKVDLEANAGYVQYSSGSVARTVDVWDDGQVAADVDADGKVLGIEVLAFDEETLSRARSYAHERGLAFPAHLEGVLAEATA